jgi:hypothetical protein
VSLSPPRPFEPGRRQALELWELIEINIPAPLLDIPTRAGELDSGKGSDSSFTNEENITLLTSSPEDIALFYRLILVAGSCISSSGDLAYVSRRHPLPEVERSWLVEILVGTR